MVTTGNSSRKNDTTIQPLRHAYKRLFAAFNQNYLIYCIGRGTLLVAQLVEALCYKPEGRGFDS
jgi:hypothetical protein